MSIKTKFSGGSPNQDLCRNYIIFQRSIAEKIILIQDPNNRYSQVEDFKRRIINMKKFVNWFENMFPVHAARINAGKLKVPNSDH